MASDGSARDIVLVVDDNRDELNMLVDALERAGFTALVATQGEMALTLLGRVMPDLVVLDALMPGLDGFETCRRIKRDGRTAHLPVIFMTGLVETRHVVMGLEAGGTDYVTKPVNLAELLARIRVHIATARAAHGARLALDAGGRHLFAVDGRGQVLWSTPQAAAVLAGPFADPVTGVITLPPAVAAHLRISAAGQEGTAIPPLAPALGIGAAHFVMQTGPDEFLFQLAEAMGAEDEKLRRVLDLTQREVEVLRWLIHGKTNKEISEILTISPRTVNKHLERIFTKMGVENRASATSLALRVISDRR